jgi:hypothetical protein
LTTNVKNKSNYCQLADGPVSEDSRGTYVDNRANLKRVASWTSCERFKTSAGPLETEHPSAFSRGVLNLSTGSRLFGVVSPA